MKIELTRELLERYLRATGVEPEGAIAFLNIFDRAVSLSELGDTTIFNLGLCAAAEHAIANIAHYPADVFYPLGNSTECISARMAIHTSRALANKLLRAAGIEPDAWEAAK